MERFHTSRRHGHRFFHPTVMVLLVLVCVAPASPARAQTAPSPNPEPVPQSPIEASLPQQEEPGRWSPWYVGLTANQGYEGGNAGSIDGTSDIRVSTGFEGTLSRSWLLRRGSIGINGNGGETIYQGGQNQFMYGLGLAVSHQFTRRLNQTFAASANRSYAEDSALLVNAGVVLPRVITRTEVFATGMTYQLSRENQIEASVSSSRAHFPSAAEFRSSSSYGFHGAFSRQINRSNRIGVSVGHTVSNGGSGDIQGLLANYTGTFGRSLTISASGGIKPYKVPGESGRRVAPGGLFGFSVATFRDHTVSASYERTVEQAFGLAGTHLCHRFNSSYSLMLGRVSVEGNLNYGINTYPELPDYTLKGGTVGGSARYSIIRNLSVGANYSLAFSHQSGIDSVNSSRAGVFLGYGFSVR